MPTDLADITSLLQAFGADESDEKKPSIFSKIINGLAMGDDKYAADMRAKDREKMANKAALKRLVISDLLTGNREESSDTRRFGHEDIMQGRTLQGESDRLDRTLQGEDARQLRSLKAMSDENRLDREAAETRDARASRRRMRETINSIDAMSRALDQRERQDFMRRLEEAHQLDPVNGIQSVIDSEVTLPRAKAKAALAEQEWLARNPYANTRVGDKMIEGNIDPTTMQKRATPGKGAPVANLKTLLSTPTVAPAPTNSPSVTNDDIMKRIRSVGLPASPFGTTGNYPPSKYD